MTRGASYPFLDAVSLGDAEQICAVAASGAELNGVIESRLPTHNYSPLTLAIENKNLTSVDTLLAVGADPNAVDPMGRTPLQAALISITLDTVSAVEAICLALISGGATVTSDTVAEAEDSYTGMGEQMHSKDFLDRLRGLAATSESPGESAG